MSSHFYLTLYVSILMLKKKVNIGFIMSTYTNMYFKIYVTF